MAVVRFERVVKISASVGDTFVGRFSAEKASDLPGKVDHARRIGRTYQAGQDAALSFSLERKVVLPIVGAITYRREGLGSGDDGLAKAQEAFLQVPKSRKKK